MLSGAEKVNAQFDLPVSESANSKNAIAQCFGIVLFCLCFTVFCTSTCVKHTSLALDGCGPRSLLAVSRQLAGIVEEKQLYSFFPNSGQGEVSFSQIMKAAKSLGITATPKRMTLAQLYHERPVGILLIDGHHFVGLIGYERWHVLRIAETGYQGPNQIQRWRDSDLAARWDGAILVLRRAQKGQTRK